MKKIFLYLTILTLSATVWSCKNYLDIVPEGVASMDNAFSNRTNAEKFLFTCYSYLPAFTNPASNVAFLGGDEYWVHNSEPERRLGINCWYIGRGEQNSNAPYLDFWEGANGGKNLWIGIRDCNIFLENISKPQDIGTMERNRWIAEVTFLKAYYHFYLLQLYGPIPIVDVNLGVDADINDVRVFRSPVDEVVDYIVATIDGCMDNLPDYIEQEGTELGRITKSIAKAMKAKTLVLAASPLFNGNSDYANFKDSRGTYLFSREQSVEKWSRAATAVKEAIDFAQTTGNHSLYYFSESPRDFSDYSKTKLSISEAVCDRWNSEIIWGATGGTGTLQTLCFPKIGSSLNYWGARSMVVPTMKVVEQFYSDNGVPVDEDNGEFWSTEYANRYTVGVVADQTPNQYNMEVGGRTAKLHLHREPRFYADLGFNRGKWYVSGNSNDNTAVANIHNYQTEYSGMITTEDFSITGYYSRKVCSYRSEITSSSLSLYNYAFPLIRLADLYLLYAECLNEVSGPSDEVFTYIDAVRQRAGLNGVRESWANYSKLPTKPNTQGGLREIIHAERLNELALEGQRFWDLRRWKVALDKKIEGWNISGKKEAEYYRLTTVWERSPYTYKDYLWPIKTSSIQKNPNLVQNPGW